MFPEKGERDESAGIVFESEVWLRKVALIEKVIVLQDQLDVGDHNLPTYRYPAGQADERTLFVVGKNLPQDSREVQSLRPLGDGVRYLVRFFPGEVNKPGANELFEIGWKKFKEQTESDASDLEAIILRADLLDGVIPGNQSFVLNGVMGDWPLQFGDNTGSIHFVREVRDSEFEATTTLFLPERFRLEVRTKLGIPAQKQISLLLGDESASSLLEDPLVLRKVQGVSNIYRSDLIAIYRSSQPELAEMISIPATPGQELMAKLIDGSAVQVEPVIAKARIQQGADVSLWEEALKDAAKCYRDRIPNPEGLSEGELAAKRAGDLTNELFLPKIRNAFVNAILPPWAATWLNEDKPKDETTMRLTLTVGDQAAMILLRDTFVELASRQRDELQAIGKHAEGIQGWAKLMEPTVRDKNSPINRIMITSPTGTKVPFEFAFYDIKNLSSTYQKDEQYIREWIPKSRQEAFQNYLTGLQTSIDQANDAKNCELKELLRLTGYGFDAVAQHLLPRLMKLEPVEDRTEWVPDLKARSNVANLYLLGAAFRAQEEVSDLDTSLVGICFAGASIPALFSGSLGFAIAALVADLGDVALIAGDRIPSWIQESRELEFAKGAADILGVERLDAAELNQTALWEKVLEIGGVGIGSLFDSLDVIRAYNALRVANIRKAGQRLFPKIREEKLKGLLDLPIEERLEFLAYLADARKSLASGGSSAFTKEQQEAVDLFNELEEAARNMDQIPQPPKKDLLAKVPVEGGTHNVGITASGRIVRCSIAN